MEITWYGHSAFSIKTARAKILVDPFFTGNPAFNDDQRQGAVDGVTHIALTHGHADHIGDTIEIAKQTGAVVIANADLAGWLGSKGVENLDPGNTGGTVAHDGFTLTWVQAHHSSAKIDENGVSNDLGFSNGLVFHIEGEKTVYHMGDTDIFGDMKLVHELHRPQVAMVPIGDRFTMGGAVAALTCRRFFEFETIIPCHYGSFPIIDQTPERFLDAMEGEKDKVLVPEKGSALTL